VAGFPKEKAQKSNILVQNCDDENLEKVDEKTNLTYVGVPFCATWPFDSETKLGLWIHLGATLKLIPLWQRRLQDMKLIRLELLIRNKYFHCRLSYLDTVLFQMLFPVLPTDKL
jgi:hypothetical protein